MSYRIEGLDPTAFADLFGRSDADLVARGVHPSVADAVPGFPCRICLDDARPGARVLLLNYEHQPAATPYRSAHAIFVCDGVCERTRWADTVPPALARRVLSLRAFDEGGMLVAGDLVAGVQLDELVMQLFARRDVAYLHAHYARLGCFAARVDRVPTIGAGGETACER